MAPRTPTGNPAPAPSLFEATTTRSATPASGFITAHCDGGARGNPGPAGYGVEITDQNGIVLAELSEFLGFRTNNYAEYSGLLASLQYALDHSHPRLRVVSDSELMVKQIQGKYKVNSPDLKPLWTEARARIAKLQSFEITHALRHKNKAADALANQAMDRGMRRGTPAEARPTLSSPTGSTRSSDGVQSLPLRAVPYPNKAETPPTPATFDPKPSPSALLPQPEQTGASSERSLLIGVEGPVKGSASAPSPTPPTPSPRPELPPALSFRPERSEVERPAPLASTPTPTMLRGFTRGGTIHLLGSHTLPDGLFVKIIPE